MNNLGSGIKRSKPPVGHAAACQTTAGRQIMSTTAWISGDGH
jgi:hypothetical protein